MSRPALVLRPAPGDAATAARLAAHGITAIRLPLFTVVPLDWALPAGAFDTLLLTSANAVRHAGAGLAAVRALPAVAVGEATAAAARDAGLDVIAVGEGDAAAALALVPGRRVLRLGGRDRTPLAGVTDVAVYASAPQPLPSGALDVAHGAVALLHSTRAATRFAMLAGDRSTIRLAAISDKVAVAAGDGWARVGTAATPDDAALVALAATLAIDP